VIAMTVGMSVNRAGGNWASAMNLGQVHGPSIEYPFSTRDEDHGDVRIQVHLTAALNCRPPA